MKFCCEVSVKEILGKMEQVEMKNWPYDLTKKNYLYFRWTLVDHMCDLGDRIWISSETIHHAVAIMDTYMSRIEDLPKTELKLKAYLIAYSCIFLSAKFCEKDSWGPTACDLSAMCRAFSNKQIIKTESEILNKIGWDLMLASPCSFLKLYNSLGYVFSDDRVPSHE